MRSKLLWLVVGLLLFATVVQGEDVAWNQDSTAAGGRRQGVLINMPTGEALPVSFSGGIDATLTDSKVTVENTVTVTGAVTTSGTVDATLTDSAVTVENTVTVDGSGVTQPISGAVTITSGSVDSTLTDSSIDDGGGSITVDGSVDVTFTDSTIQATDLDIRDLSSASDSVTNIMADVTLADTIVEVTLADTSVNYSYALPAKTVAYEFWSDTGVAFTWAFSTGGIATNYMKQQASTPYASFQLGSEMLYTGTLWFKDPTVAGTIICLHIITKP